jgi:glutathione S-transferase
MYQLYIANKNYSSWSLRPWLLMTTLTIPFQEKSVYFTESSWNAFRIFSPSGKVPCLVTEHMTVWDSLAITEFIAESYPQVWPSNVRARAWARSACAEMHAGFQTLRNICPMNCSIFVQLDQIDEGLQKDIDRIDELWNQALQQFGGNFLTGNQFTAVDAFFAPVVLRIRTYGLQLSDAAMAYCGLIEDLPALGAWVKSAQLEPPEATHETACVQYGKLTHDFRNKHTI